MVGFGEISAGLSSLKAAADIIRGLHATATKASINELKVELTGHILEAQQALAAAQLVESDLRGQIAMLEQKVRALDDWLQEKQRYQLAQIDVDSFAYILKDGEEQGEPPHWLCANCFEHSKKSILQFQGTEPSLGGRGQQSDFKCSGCNGHVIVSARRHPGTRYTTES